MDLEDFFFNPVTLIGGGLVLVIGLCWLMVTSENKEIAAFQARCVAAGETAAKCQILSEIKRSADDAAMSAAFAAGAAASSSGRR